VPDKITHVSCFEIYEMRIILSLFAILIFISCQQIETGDSLDKKTIALVKSMGLLSNDEKIIRYYSNYSKSKAGNFFTNKRLAMYWLDDHDLSKNDTSFAFYQDIISIDTTYRVPDTFIPYMLITRNDSSQFKVYIDGSRKDVKSFFEDAIILWQKSRKK
jgi:hypothetical protein